MMYAYETNFKAFAIQTIHTTSVFRQWSVCLETELGVLAEIIYQHNFQKYILQLLL